MQGRPARRSVLCVPGGDAHKIAKALRADADQIVIDLEDAVAPADKAAARSMLDAIDWGRPADLPAIAVRVNAPRTRWCHLDIAAVVQSSVPASSIVLPKVESPGDLAFAERLLDGLEATEPTRITVGALIETADGLGRVARIARSSRRLSALIVGYADLAASLGRAGDAGPGAWIAVQDRVITAARMNRLAAVDGPFLGLGVDEEFVASVEVAVRIGFDAKWAVHPRQIGTINAAFAPSAEQIRHARRVVEMLDAAHDGGRGAIELDGRMIDEAVAVGARRVLARIGESR